MTEQTTKNPFDIARVDRALEQISLHPETWRQQAWRCDTGMCLAGWVIEQNGDQWANPDPNGSFGTYVLVDAGTPGSMSEEYMRRHRDAWDVTIPEGKALMSASQRADLLLGLTGESHDLYNEHNDLETLRELRDQMADGQVPLRSSDDEDDYYDEDEDY